MDDNKERGSRRDFLKMASVSAPAALAAAALPAGQAEAADLPQSGDRMQDTAHTRAYYDSARF
ncbi:MAG: twin-arginine translocation signal domain-containing protein [Tranquillimonas sp.]